MDYALLGAAIRKKRIERGWKIAILADKAGVSEDFIGKIERATDIPSLQTVVAIANALEVSVDSLLRNDLSKRKKLFLQFVQNNVEFFNKADFEFDE